MTIALDVAEDRIARLAQEGLDLPAFWQQCSAVIARAVPHFQSPCWFTLDPATLLATSHYQTELPELPEEWMAYEYLEEDYHSLAGVARSKMGASTLHEVTGGDPSKSRAWRDFIVPYGGDQELLVALRDRAGSVWGVVGLYREPDRPQFSVQEVEFMRTVAPALAAGAQRGLLIAEAAESESPEAPGLLVLNEDFAVDSVTPGTERWLDELPQGSWQTANKLPPAVLAVAGRALRSAEDENSPGDVAFARVLSQGGRWVVLHGASMTGSGSRRVAVIIEPAHPARISPLLMAAYNLTDREQEVTRLVLQGDSTAQIAEALFVSPHTVQQHLKTIFEKTGVRSRRDLVGKVFFAHYEPRMRDNEQRVSAGRPVRGGPVELAGSGI
jgi:DNA-binding CsgD family transcriptional regulator